MGVVTWGMRAVAADDDQLVELETLWAALIEAFESVTDDDEQEFDQAARRLEEVERRVAVTPAHTDVGIAVKLRIMLSYESDEAEKRHWFPMLQSVLEDMERRTGRRFKRTL